MMRSMYSGVSGLGAHQVKMDVIANNIANVNTIGFKAQRANFSEVFSQTLQGSMGSNEATGQGGRNAMQVGLGVGVSSIDILMTQGSAQRTDNPFDLMIDGEGFIVVGDSSGQYFTRAGALRQDDDGNLVIPNGMKVMGWPANADGSEIMIGEVQPITLGDPQNKTAPPETTTLTEIAGNLDKSATMPVPVNQKVYDSLGNPYTIMYEFTYHEAEEVVQLDDDGNPVLDGEGNEVMELRPARWDVEIPTETVNGVEMMVLTDTKNNKIAVPSFFNLQTQLDEDGEPVLDDNGNEVEATQALSIHFDESGELILNEGEQEKFFTLDAIDLNKARDPETGETKGINSVIGGKVDADGTVSGSIEVDITGLTQFSSQTTVESKTVDGKSAGTMMGFDITGDGKITAYYDNGSTKLLGQMSLAQFENPSGLEKVGDNLFKATANSGDFDNIGTQGSFQSGVLEMSNVDLSREFTDMITTQRGYQANSRIITVSDELLQELVNLKR